VPLVLVVEDNGIGISVPTPKGWVKTAYSSRPGLTYVPADGADPARVYAATVDAANTARRHRRPVLLHLSTVRYLGHAGSDAEISYRTTSDIERDYERDPLLGTARALVEGGHATPAEVLRHYDAARASIDAETSALGQVRLLESAAEVMAPISPRTPDEVEHTASTLLTLTERPPRTLAESINATLADALAADRRFIVFGEDVGKKGGVYGATRGLSRRFGPARVFDTLLDEQSILGMGLGAGLAGLIPVPEIQYLAYLHNAEDQLRGEAATLSFFSQGQYRNPLVVRIAGLAYQKGFGGHFHNDNSPAILRDIPGLVVACPSRGDDAAAMLRTCLAAALVDGTVSAFLEPIALYHTRDLLEKDDSAWLAPDHGAHVPIGQARTYGANTTPHTDLTIITFGNGVPMSLRVGRRLTSRGMGVRVVDLRWLAPLPVDDIVREAEASGRVLVVDETRASGGVGEGVIAALVDAGYAGRIARVSSRDSFIPLGTAANEVLLSEDEIEKSALSFP
jgi:2-oxoisovalerate dehydrogenase E1 component